MVAGPMQKGRRHQVTIQLDPDQTEALDRLAMSRRITRSAIVRTAVDVFLAVNRSDAHMIAIAPSDETERIAS